MILLHQRIEFGGQNLGIRSGLRGTRTQDYGKQQEEKFGFHSSFSFKK
jgi:hypothetical protein